MKVEKLKMKFFEFDQNNSGGHFDVNKKVCHRVFIEAKTEQEAIAKFKPMIEDQSSSCPCCGDRWNIDWAEEITFPLVYSKENNIILKGIISYCKYLKKEHGWTEPDCRLYYANGKIKDI